MTVMPSPEALGQAKVCGGRWCLQMAGKRYVDGVGDDRVAGEMPGTGGVVLGEVDFGYRQAKQGVAFLKKSSAKNV